MPMQLINKRQRNPKE